MEVEHRMVRTSVVIEHGLLDEKGINAMLKISQDVLRTLPNYQECYLK